MGNDRSSVGKTMHGGETDLTRRDGYVGRHDQFREKLFVVTGTIEMHGETKVIGHLY